MIQSYIYSFFHILFPYDTEYSFLFFTVGPCCLSILYILFSSTNPKLPFHPSPPFLLRKPKSVENGFNFHLCYSSTLMFDSGDLHIAVTLVQTLGSVEESVQVTEVLEKIMWTSPALFLALPTAAASVPCQSVSLVPPPLITLQSLTASFSPFIRWFVCVSS